MNWPRCVGFIGQVNKATHQRLCIRLISHLVSESVSNILQRTRPLMSTNCVMKSRWLFGGAEQNKRYCHCGVTDSRAFVA